MLSARENERLTRVGPGTPMGELMRRYWHPVAASGELAGEPTKAVRLLGEDLVLYRDRGGALGLIQESCPHRRVNLLYGIPEQRGLRCPYHGWLFDETGRCLETPAEAPESTFRDRVRATAYPVQELNGLIFAYLGPEPAPLLPRWDLFTYENSFRHIGHTIVPCNWVQCMENSVDPVHTEWLHGRLFQYVTEGEGTPEYVSSLLKRHVKIGFDVFEHGIIKRRVVEGQTEEHENWRVGHPLVFPNILRVTQGGNGHSFQYRVPMDDTHTYHVWYNAYLMPPGVQAPKQEQIPHYEVPLVGDDGRHIIDNIDSQDMMAWVTEGPVHDRSKERLAESDKGIILYRRLLREQMERVAEGLDPMNVFRDPAKAQDVRLVQDAFDSLTRATPGSLLSNQAKYSPAAGELEKLLTRAAEVDRAGAGGG